MAKILVLISGNGSNLQAILDHCHQQNEMEVVAVIANKADAYGLTRAHQAGIDALVIESQSYRHREHFERQLTTQIDLYNPDLIVLAGFMRILTPEFVNRYSGKILNIHPSLLPKYPGLHTHQKAIQSGDREHGASIHFVTEALDGGPLILQVKVPILTEDNVQSLSQRVQSVEHQIYPQVIEWFCQGRIIMQRDRVLFDGVYLDKQGIILGETTQFIKSEQ